MEKMILEGVELEFNDLSEHGQKKLYLHDKKKFKSDAAKSEYANIRKLLIEDKECESSILDEIFKVEIPIYENFENIVLIWNHPKFEKNDEKRKILSESDDASIRIIAAIDRGSSSKFLNEMMIRELQGQDYDEVKKAIMNNPNFTMKKATSRVLATSNDPENRVIAAEKETDSSKLNEMLRNEVQEFRSDSDVKEAIKENPNFKIEEETIKVLANSNNWEDRVIAAQEETDSSKLNEMLREEVRKFDNDSDVKEAIKENPNFKIEKETIEVLLDL